MHTQILKQETYCSLPMRMAETTYKLAVVISLGVLIVFAIVFFITTTFSAVKIREVQDEQKEDQKQLESGISQLRTQFQESSKMITDGLNGLQNETELHFMLTSDKLDLLGSITRAALSQAVETLTRNITQENEHTRNLISASLDNVTSQFNTKLQESQAVLLKCLLENNRAIKNTFDTVRHISRTSFGLSFSLISSCN